MKTNRGIVLTIGTGIVALVAFSIAVVPHVSTPRSAVMARADRQSPSKRPPMLPHGAASDFTVNSVAGVSLDDALSQVGTTVALPTSETVGAPEKVVLDSQVKETGGHYGLLILYSTGIRLIVEPGTLDLAGLQKAGGWGKFDDGRKLPFSIDAVAGRERLVNPGGMQTMSSGARRMAPSVVTWNQDGMTYTLTVASGSKVPVSGLLAAARSMK